MLIWGVVWGSILGYLWRGHGSIEGAILGAILGAIAGRTLRGVVRKEIEAQRATRPAGAPPAQAPAAEFAAQPAPEPEPVPALVPSATSDAGPIAAEPTAAAGIQPAQPVEAQPAPGIEEPAGAQPDLPPPSLEPDPVTRMLGKARDWLLGGNTIVRAGVLVLFVGLAFLAKYAVDHALLPPELRLAGIALAGVALFAGGFWLRRKPGRLVYALTLQGAGVAVLYLTVFAAFRLYQFLPPGAAFLLLGLICLFSAVIALAQNAPAMAFVGFAGGFAAPILVSTGEGNHVNLFSYYLVLNLAIAAIAWAKAWRALNLLGFFATFGIATLWGVLKYRPEQLASTEPFLLAFFLVYVLASLLYATRHSLAARQAVDATLIFGTPIVAFGLQVGMVRHIEYASAFSALALGAFYLVLGWWMFSRARGADERQQQVGRWLAECFAALGLGFVTLAVPLALDGRLTSAVWAAEGAAVYWMGRRQGRWLARLAGLALQLLAAIAYLDSMGHGPDSPWPLANPAFIGALLLAGSAVGIAWWSRATPGTEPAAPKTGSVLGFAELEGKLSPFLFWVGFLWWQFGLSLEIERAPVDAQGLAVSVFESATQLHLQMLAWVLSAFVAQRFAPAWPITATPAWFTLPVMLLAAAIGLATMDHVLQSWGWLAWPLALALHLLMLRRLDGGSPQRWWPWVHAGGLWLLVLLAANLLLFSIGEFKLWDTAWAEVILLDAGIAVLLLLSERRWFERVRNDGSGSGGWPLDRFARAYLWTAAAPLALAVAFGALLVAVQSDGNARPLPYIPLLNPTDLSIALALAICALWLLHVRRSALAVPAWVRGGFPLAVLVGIAFVAINTVWLRVAHHFASQPWDAGRLFNSFLVQAGYSILWTVIALGLMVAGYRRAMRLVWMLGAGLMGATVLKLFLIDLSNRGGSERIVVFIAVGILMLVIGYFAPIPPPARPAAPDDLAGDKPA